MARMKEVHGLSGELQWLVAVQSRPCHAIKRVIDRLIDLRSGERLNTCCQKSQEIRTYR